MGIPGLKTFVENNDLLKNVTTADFNGVVVDGKSLMYHLTRRFRLTCTYGGQYPELAHMLEVFLTALRSNRIRVVVVFGSGIFFGPRRTGPDHTLHRTVRKMAESV